jgi:hypothetical protein
MGESGMLHAFSIEMKSKTHVRHISMSDESHDRVLFEGYLGALKELSLIEGTVLEVKGENGVLRIDLTEEELRKMLSGQEHSLKQST